MPLLQLQLVAGSTFTFDIEGEPTITHAREHKENSSPLLLARYAETWEITGAMFSLGTSATHDSAVDSGLVWTKLDSLFTLLNDRDTTPITTARLVRDPTGLNVTERILGAPTFERFALTDVRVGDDPEVAELDGSQWELILRVDLTVTAERVFSDADGVSEFDQVVEFTYDKGFQRASKTTTVVTAEGTSAETIARSLGAWNITDFGSNYHWVTNGDDGVDIRILDADDRTTANGSAVGGDGAGGARVPTRVEATSVVQQTGSSVGGNTAGNSPQNMFFSIRTETNRNLETTTYEAGADGPGGKQWILARAPAGGFTVRVTDYDDERREYRATWIREKVLNTDSELSAVITGGRKRKVFRELTGGKRPALQIGSFTPYTLTVTVRKEFVGVRPVASDMPLPPLLPEPWVFDADASSEDVIPRLIEPSADLNSQRWERNATLVYQSGEKPGSLATLANQLRTGTRVSYYDGA